MLFLQKANRAEHVTMMHSKTADKAKANVSLVVRWRTLSDLMRPVVLNKNLQTIAASDLLVYASISQRARPPHHSHSFSLTYFSCTNTLEQTHYTSFS